MMNKHSLDTLLAQSALFVKTRLIDCLSSWILQLSASICYMCNVGLLVLLSSPIPLVLLSASLYFSKRRILR